MAYKTIEVKKKDNGKWEIIINEESTGKEYLNQHNALYWAVRIADKIGENIVRLPGHEHCINSGDII